jgi:hypothetical protein
MLLACEADATFSFARPTSGYGLLDCLGGRQSFSSFAEPPILAGSGMITSWRGPRWRFTRKRIAEDDPLPLSTVGRLSTHDLRFYPGRTFAFPQSIQRR